MDAAEKNAARFNLTQADLASRRRWIMETNREVIAIMASVPALSKASLTEIQALQFFNPPPPLFIQDNLCAGIYLQNSWLTPTAHAVACAGA